MTGVELKALIDSLYPNNTTGLITPAAERQALKAIVDFAAENQGTVDTSSFLFDPNFSYSIGDPVIYNLQWYVSQEDNNIGNIPSSSAEWSQINAFDGTFGFWEAGLYVGSVVFVVNNDILYFLDREEVGNDPFNSSNFANELAAGSWVALTADGIPDAPADGETYARKDQAWVALADVVAGARIQSFSINITSATAATVSAVWYNAANAQFSVVDQAIVFAGAPAADTFRWDLIELLSNGNINVNTGTAADPAVRPTPTANALIGWEGIWNSSGEVNPAPGQNEAVVWSNIRYATQLAANTTGKYAKIWEGTLSISNNYAIDIVFNDPKNGINFDGSGVGRLKVSWTCDTSRNILADTVKFFTDPDGIPGEFRLVQIAGNRAAIYHKGSHFWSRIDYRVIFHSQAVQIADFVNGGVYGNAPTAVATYDSRQSGLPDYLPSTGTILFDAPGGRPRAYGMTTPLTGDIVFGTAGALTSVMVQIRHNSDSEPSFSAPVGVTLWKDGGDYVVDVDNIIDAICQKNDAGEVVRIRYSISQNQSE